MDAQCSQEIFTISWISVRIPSAWASLSLRVIGSMALRRTRKNTAGPHGSPNRQRWFTYWRVGGDHSNLWRGWRYSICRMSMWRYSKKLQKSHKRKVNIRNATSHERKVCGKKREWKITERISFLRLLKCFCTTLFSTVYYNDSLLPHVKRLR